MKTIGVRELRQNASVVLREVEAGGTFEVTDRGRPVALLSPLPNVGVLERLRIEGEVESAQTDLRNLAAPLRMPKGSTRPSALLRRLRSDER
ncbi:MAG TPA: type II toxin-antitoxin system prevent-host-death family antitoxin [Polyangiaceae bacterium]|jgi:prevent-host-death family protein